MIKIVRNTALAAVAAVSLGAATAQAAPINVGSNAFQGSLNGVSNLAVDLNQGAFNFAGQAGAKSGTLTVEMSSTGISQTMAGSLAILIDATKKSRIVPKLMWGNVEIALTKTAEGYEAVFEGPLPGTLAFSYSKAKRKDQISLSAGAKGTTASLRGMRSADFSPAAVSAVPLPPAMLLLLGAIGGLAYLGLRRDKETSEV